MTSIARLRIRSGRCCDPTTRPPYKKVTPTLKLTSRFPGSPPLIQPPVVQNPQQPDQQNRSQHHRIDRESGQQPEGRNPAKEEQHIPGRDRAGRLAANGAFRPVIDRQQYRLDKLVEAHRSVQNGHKVGRAAVPSIPAGSPAASLRQRPGAVHPADGRKYSADDDGPLH